MSVDLEKLGKMVDEALANETKESLTEWLDERRQNAKTEESNCTIHSVMPRFDSPKNWKEDCELENGNYICRCSLCKEYFYGYKRRVICKECAK
jgi:hypothetical protein